MRKFIITEIAPDEYLREEGSEPAVGQLAAVSVSIKRELEESLSTYPFDLRHFLEV